MTVKVAGKCARNQLEKASLLDRPIALLARYATPGKSN